MIGGGLFHLLVLLFGWRWLSAVLRLPGRFIAPQQGHFGLSPAMSSVLAAPISCGWPLASGSEWILLIIPALFADVQYSGQENNIQSAKAVDVSAGVH